MNRIVVTDDQGRYVVPDLPKAAYDVWVRGYGLVDSPKVTASPGKALNLTAVLAPDPRAAAQYYPASYWFALLSMPDKSEFPGTGPRGNGIAPGMRSQAQWIANIKTTTCTPCHQLGNKATREIPQIFRGLSTVDAWDRRTDSGVDDMYAYLPRFGKARLLATLADWTDRIAAGEYPREAPPRPRGVERNIVITQWDWANPNEYFHDSVASDKRNPAVNANGAVYGVHELSSDRSDREQHDAAHDSDHRSGPGPGCAAPRRTLRVLGRRGLLGQPRHHAQQRDGSEGARLEHVAPARRAEPGLLQGGLEPPVREALSARDEQPPARRLRSEDEVVQDARHLLRHVPPQLRARRQQYALVRRRRRRRLDRHARVG